MSGGGEMSPRQKMINLMYLVLMALLALNISAEVLNAFEIVNESLIQSQKINKKKNMELNTKIESFLERHESKKQEFSSVLESFNKRMAEEYAFVDTVKANLLRLGGSSATEDSVLSKDNTDYSSFYMVTQQNGYELQKRLNKFKNYIFETIIDTAMYPSIFEEISKILETKSPKQVPGEIPKDWVEHSFDNMPLIGAISVLLKLKLSLSSVETSVFNHIYSKIDYEPFKFNSIKTEVLMSTNVTKGDDFEAYIFTTAVDTNQRPKVFIKQPNQTSYREVKEFDEKRKKVLFKETTTSLGVKNYEGYLQLLAANGDIVKLPFDFSYQVNPSAVTVAPIKMNVVYRTIPNPLEIAAQGYKADDLVVSVTNASTKKMGNGTYEIVPGSASKCVVTVSAKNQEGSGTKVLGKSEFRVKNVPPPIAKVGGLASGSISKSLLQAQTGVIAVLEDFDFDLRYIITRFTLSYTTADGYSTDLVSEGPYFTSKQKQVLQSLTPGKRIAITSIYAKLNSPNSKEIPLDNSISLKIK